MSVGKVNARQRNRGAIYRQTGPSVQMELATGENVEPGKVSFRGRGMPAPPGIERSDSGSAPEAWVNTSGSFLSTNFDHNGTYNMGFRFIPPDSHLAAGPLHVVSVVNTTISFHQKDGTLDYRDSLESFFSAVSPLTFTFDPKVVYDQYNERWLVVTMEQTEVASGDPADTSRIFLGVSDDANPNGIWHVVEFNSRLNISGSWWWADYPGFAVGEDAVYITANMFGFISGGGQSRLWIVDKGDGSGGFYDGGTADFSLENPYLGAGLATTTQPAHMYGTIPGDTDTYLVSYSGLHAGNVESIQVVRLDDPLGTPTFTQAYISLGDIENTNQPLADAPQSGTGTLIEVNDRRALDAVWIDDELWMTATIRAPSGADSGQATAYWWQVDTTMPDTLALLDQATIGGEDIAAGTSTFFPSVAVNGYGDVTFGFSASAASIFAGAYFVNREAGDPAGTTGSSQTVAAGTDYYIRTFGGPRNRWGDYSATVVDPADGCFWVYNEYAMTRGTIIVGEDGRWATAVAKSCNLTHPCSDSVNIPAGAWTRFALPCNVAPDNTVEDVFSGLVPGDYGIGWRVYRRESSSPPQYQLMALTDTMEVGEGYWIITTNATTVNVNGTINALEDIELFSESPGGRQNYIGHNQNDTVSWADVRFVSGGDLLTLDDVETAGSASRQMYKWNGAAYQVYNGIDPQTGSLDSFDGFWVKAFDPDMKIRIPQADAVSVSATASAAPLPAHLESSSTESVAESTKWKKPKKTQTWHIQLTATSGSLVDPGNFFGRKDDGSDDMDRHDLAEPQPFGDRYLTVLFTNSKLKGADWGYTSDFRKARNNPKGEWPFVVRASQDVEIVTLSWVGDDFLFEDAWLQDEGTGELFKVHSGESYTFEIEGGERHFTFEID